MTLISVPERHENRPDAATGMVAAFVLAWRRSIRDELLAFNHWTWSHTAVMALSLAAIGPALSPRRLLA